MVYIKAFASLYLFHESWLISCLYISVRYLACIRLKFLLNQNFFFLSPYAIQFSRYYTRSRFSESLFIIHRTDPFVNTFFKLFSSFFARCATASGDATLLMLPPFLLIVNTFFAFFQCPPPPRCNVRYITTFLPSCQHLFSTFFIIFS